MELQWRHQSQRASRPAALLNANQQTERPTLLLGDWERGHWLVCHHCPSVLLTVSELTQVSSDSHHFQVQQMSSNETKQLLRRQRATIKPAQMPNQCISIHAENRASHKYSSYWNGNYILNELGAVPSKPDVGKETSLLQNDGLSGNAQLLLVASFPVTFMKTLWTAAATDCDISDSL